MDVIRGLEMFHIGLRAQLSGLLADAQKLTGGEALSAFKERLGVFAQMHEIHSDGEERVIFPNLHTQTPRVCEAYSYDHQVEAKGLTALVEAVPTGPNPAQAALDALRQKLAVAGAKLLHHMAKEEALLVPLLRELPQAQRDEMHLALTQANPPEHSRVVLPWMARHLPPAERKEFMDSLWKQAPAIAHPFLRTWITDGLTPAEWEAICTASPQVRAD